jgi:F-type H+-transporting ATPase subunit alpha
MKAQHGALVDKIESTKDLDKDGEAQLAAAIAEFKKNWA